MGDNQHPAFRPALGIHAVRDNFQRIHIQPGISFIQHCQAWLEQRHLQNFIAFFLTAGKTDIHSPFQHFIIHAQISCSCPHQFDKLQLIHLILAGFTAAGIYRSTQKGHTANARQFDRILKGQEHPCPGALICFHFQNRLAIKQYIAFGYLIAITAGQHIGQGGFTRSIWPHNRMNLAAVNGQINPVQDFCIANRGV